MKKSKFLNKLGMGKNHNQNKNENMDISHETGGEKEDYYKSQWKLIVERLWKHKLAVISMYILVFLYLLAIFSSFIAPQSNHEYDSDYMNISPMSIHFFDEEGKFHLRPFVHGLTSERDPETFRKTYVEDTETKYPIHFFVKGSEYKIFGLFKSKTHLFGVKDPGKIFILGTDGMGRDMFSRIVLGSKVSLSIPLVGVSISLIIGFIIGGISGYFGRWIDAILQRVIEIVRSFPELPLWMALSAAIPPNIPVVQMYLYIVIIISFISWSGLARVVRGQFISLKTEEYVLAAQISGVRDSKIITKHLLPGIYSYLIVQITVQIPAMILAETSMSFLGLGIRSPATSWGVLLQEAQDITNVALYPWKLIPLLFVVLTILCFNFFGDGLRDAADPYKKL